MNNVMSEDEFFEKNVLNNFEDNFQNSFKKSEDNFKNYDPNDAIVESEVIQLTEKKELSVKEWIDVHILDAKDELSQLKLIQASYKLNGIRNIKTIAVNNRITLLNEKIKMYKQQKAMAIQQEKVTINDKDNDIVASAKKAMAKMDYRLDKEGEMIFDKTMYNCRIALENDARFKGHIKFNEFTNSCEISFLSEEHKQSLDKLTTKEKEALDDTLETERCLLDSWEILQREYQQGQQQNNFDNAIRKIAYDNKYHPLRKKIKSIEWDGKKRIDTLFSDWLGVENDEYVKICTKTFLMGALVRVFEPGKPFRYTLITKGKQGFGKSTFFKFLTMDDKYFTDSIKEIDTKDSLQLLKGKWIVEFGELNAISSKKASVEAVKAFLTSTTDNYRVPYEKNPHDYKRQCVFTASTNSAEFLIDDTGSTRFMVFECSAEKRTKNCPEGSQGEKDAWWKEQAKEIEQVWAEAYHYYINDDYSLELPEWAKQMQEERNQKYSIQNPRADKLIEWLDKIRKLNITRVNNIMIANECFDELNSFNTHRECKKLAFEYSTLMSNYAKDWQCIGKQRAKSFRESYDSSKAYELIQKEDDKLDLDKMNFNKFVDKDEIPF